MTSLLARLTEMANRREEALRQVGSCIPEVAEMARQDVADIREAVRLLGQGSVH